MTDQKTNVVQKHLAIAISILILCLLVSGVLFLELGRSYYSNKAIPRQTILGYKFSGLSSTEAQAYLSTVLNQFLTDKVVFNFKDQELTTTYSDLGVTADYSRNFNQLKFYQGKPTRTQFLKDLFSFNTYKLRINSDMLDFESSLTSRYPIIAPAKSATFAWNELTLAVQPEAVGNNTNFAELRKQVLNFQNPIEIEDKLEIPTVTQTDLLPLLDTFQVLVSRPIKLTAPAFSYELNLGQVPEVVHFVKKDNQLAVQIDQIYLTDIIDQFLVPELESPAEEVLISLVDDKVKFEGIGKNGISIDKDSLNNQVNQYLSSSLFPIEDQEPLPPIVAISLTTIEPNFQIAPELQERGITELVSFGYTTFHGSPANRIHNIKVGAERYNGLIIPKGATFSFNDNLGPVDASAGYLPELVIKSEGTIPEFGGGLCQVSTNIYRGVLYGGFDVVERYNHSYSVGYYAQVLGEGLDATIYPGVKDFKFVNDTPSDLLMQNFVEGTTMTTRFFGTKDDRKVELVGPKILSRTGSGTPIYEEKPDLAPGTVKQVDKPVNGVSAEWERIITFGDGTIKNEVITSRYRSVPAKYHVGPAANPITPNPELSSL